MELALHYSNFSFPGGTAAIPDLLGRTAQAADEGGFAAMTLMDHWFQIENIGPATESMLEGYSGLAFVAAKTSRLRLGLLVTGVTYRHPGLLAKTVTTLDVLSAGRAFLGIGAAWYEREHAALGVPYPPLAERFDRLEETLRICEQMWSDDDGPFEGRHYRLAETLCVPRPVQQPRPPILIGGMGEQKTLRLVARHADLCNLFALGPDVVGHKIDVLRGHLADAGRPEDAVRRTIIVGGDPLADVDAFLASMEPYAALGVDRVWAGPAGPDPVAWTERMAERVVPRLRDLG